MCHMKALLRSYKSLNVWLPQTFSQFPDFSLLEIKFLWPNQYKMSDVLVASCLPLQSSFFIKEKHCWDHSDPACFFKPLIVLDQPCQIISIYMYFLWFFFKNCLPFYPKSSSLTFPGIFSFNNIITRGNSVNGFLHRLRVETNHIE